MTTVFPAAQAVRLRRDYAETLVTNAWRGGGGKRICVLACGHFREGNRLIGHDLSNIAAVDQDGLSLDIVRRNHGETTTTVDANVSSYLRRSASRGEKFDLV